MKLYNSFSRDVEPFDLDGKKVRIYVCGITPYDTTHLGHAFTYTVFDVLIRYLELRGYEVEYVQNVTDVDDDILRKARLEGEDWRALGNQWTEYYVRDMQNLNVRAPDHFPRATQVIPGIIEDIQKLLAAGVAYESGGNVYFSIDAWPEFGRLSRLSRPDMLTVANERGNNPNDPHKRDPLDFVLWQAKYEDEPSWPSPWGEGRPGWHIECSTLSTRHLGDKIDIHGGGLDLTFPHHECEIAQVEAVEKEPFVRFWMHTAMVRHKGAKMSKSLGNLIMVRSLLDVFSPDAVRLYLGSHHYREAWEYNAKDLEKREKMAEKIRQALIATGGTGPALSPDPAWAAFTAAMDNDLDTPKALNVIEGLTDQINEAALGKREVVEAQKALRTFGAVFGLRSDMEQVEPRVLEGWNACL